MTAIDLPVFPRPPILLSASIPLITRDPVYFSSADQIAIRDAVVALATAVLPVTGLVFGGHPAITPLIRATAQGLRARAPIQPVVLYQSGFFVEQPSEPADVMRTIIVRAENDRKRSLEVMREQMMRAYPYQHGVFIGGMEGVEEEFDLFRKWNPKAAVLPIGSTGAAAAMILANPNRWTGGRLTDVLMRDKVYLALFRRLLGMG
jgi:hypothetical protein